MELVETLEPELDQASDDATEPETPAVDPKALAELMPAFERLICIGVYYPTGHPSCDLAARSVQSAIQRVVGKAPSLQIEVHGDDLYVQGVDLDPEERGVSGFRVLLEDVGIVDLSIDPEIDVEDLYRFATRLLELQQEARSARSFTQLDSEGLPTSVRVRDREYLARLRETETAANRFEGGDANDPGLETLLGSLGNHGLNRRQLELCQRFLEALPQHVENHRLSSSSLMQTTWQDVEKLLIKAVRQRSFERASSAAQQMAIRKNLGSLFSLFEEIGDDSANQDWSEAVDLLLSLNQRPDDGAAEADQSGSAASPQDEPDDSEAVAAMRADLAVQSGPEPAGAVALMPADHLEELTVLLQILQQEQPISSVARIQRRLGEILMGPLSDDELLALAGGVRGILSEPPAEHLDTAAAMVLEIARRTAPDVPPRLVCALADNLPSERRPVLWPFAVNELLMADSAVTGSQYEQLAALVAEVPVAAVGSLTPRVEQLEALRERRLVRDAARRLPRALFLHFAALLDASTKQPLGEWLLHALRLSPPCRLSRTVLPLLDRVRPVHRSFLVEILRQDGDETTNQILSAGAAAILSDELAYIARERRGEEWVVGAVRLLHKLDAPEADDILRRIKSERWWLILPGWPSEPRQTAGALLDQRKDRAA